MNKASYSVLSIDEYTNLDIILNQFKSDAISPYIAFIGPTDFLSCDNGAEVLSDPNVIALLHHFTKISLQTTLLLFDKAEELANILKKHYSNLQIEINIVLEPTRIRQPSYRDKLKSRKKHFSKMLGRHDIESYGIINITDFKEHEISNDHFKTLQDLSQFLITTGIDYNLSLARLPNIPTHIFEDYGLAVKKLHDNISYNPNIQEKVIPFSERQYAYASGKIYLAPLFYEYIPTFHSDLLIGSTQELIQNFTAREEILIQKQIDIVSKQDECENCTLLNHCINRSVIHFMHIAGSKKCFMPKVNKNLFYQMGTLPID